MAKLTALPKHESDRKFWTEDYHHGIRAMVGPWGSTAMDLRRAYQILSEQVKLDFVEDQRRFALMLAAQESGQELEPFPYISPIGNQALMLGGFAIEAMLKGLLTMAAAGDSD